MLTPEQVELLKTTIAKGLSDLELQLFLNVCDRTGLDPFARQICPVLRVDRKTGKTVLSIQVQIDGYRQIAQNTGEYAGCDRALFDEGLTLYEHLQAKRGKPKTCTITVYRLIKGVRCPFTADVSWDDFYPGDKLGFMWNSKPHQMISKTCESQALRKAFQSELKYLKTEEEIVIESTDPSPRQVQRSDDWMEMQANLRTAKTVEEVNAIAVTVQNRLPMAGSRYQLEKELEIAQERLRMTAPVAVAVTPEAKPVSVAVAPETRQRLEEICRLTAFQWKEISRLCQSKLGKSEDQLAPEDVRKLRGLLFLEWATMQHQIEWSDAIEYWKAFFLGDVSNLPDAELFAQWKTYLAANAQSGW